MHSHSARSLMVDPAEQYAEALAAGSRGDWRRALSLAKQLLPRSQDHPGLHYIAGVANLELQQLPQAIGYLRRAVELDPARSNFATLYAKALSLAGFQDDALKAADHALSLSPANPQLLSTLGMIYALGKAHARAATLQRRAVELLPDQSMLRYQLATSLMFLGQIDAAENELEICLTLNPRFWKAHLSLTMLRRQTPGSNHVDRLENMLAQIAQNHADPAALVCVHMALAKELEDLGRYPEAFAHLVSGKSAGGRHRHYSSQRDETLFASIEAAFPEYTTAPSGCESDAPIFVIGMPRSGTTLVERILSSHPDVASAGELLNFGMALKQASGSLSPVLLDPETIARAQRTSWKTVGESYIASTRAAFGDKPRFIDKLPLNFLYAGFIANALPNAKIICLRRDPMDTCLSNFRQLFASDSPYFDYSYDLLDTGRYFLLFDHLMAHWLKVLPGRILEIRYEILVENQESTSRQLLAFCGLSWDDACLLFENNPAPVATASAVQVREPIYRSAIGRWKRYAGEMQDLRNLLIAGGVSLD